MKYHFASDNTAGICPEAWAALAAANADYVSSYGADPSTQQACDLIRRVFEKPDAEIFFVFNGTAANSLALASLCQSYHSVICHEFAHVATDECGAPEFFSNGTKLLLAEGADGKIGPGEVERLVLKRSDIHYPKPRALSLTQTTECGTVYTVDEITALCRSAAQHGLAVHMDGSRFANALSALQSKSPVTAADATWRAGVDVLCLGGTKNGLTTTEAVVFFNPALAREFDYRCKQAGQLSSKMRFLSAQWIGLLRDGVWLKNAARANAMAQQLGAALAANPAVKLLREPEANAVFATMPAEFAAGLKDRGWQFYAFIGGGYRFMCSWATQPADVEALATDLADVTRKARRG